MVKIKYRTCEYDTKDNAQKFEYIINDYAYDNAKDCLVVVGTIDIQEKIQSNADCALDKILDKFILHDNIDNHVVQLINDEAYDCSNIDFDLSELGKAYEELDILKEKYNVPANYSSVRDVVSYLNKVQSLYSEKIKNKKEVLKNENAKKEIIEENKQASI
jgi:hypothetical protein